MRAPTPKCVVCDGNQPLAFSPTEILLPSSKPPCAYAPTLAFGEGRVMGETSFVRRARDAPLRDANGCGLGRDGLRRLRHRIDHDRDDHRDRFIELVARTLDADDALVRAERDPCFPTRAALAHVPFDSRCRRRAAVKDRSLERRFDHRAERFGVDASWLCVPRELDAMRRFGIRRRREERDCP